MGPRERGWDLRRLQGPEGTRAPERNVQIVRGEELIAGAELAIRIFMAKTNKTSKKSDKQNVGDVMDEVSRVAKAAVGAAKSVFNQRVKSVKSAAAMMTGPKKAAKKSAKRSAKKRPAKKRTAKK